MIYSDKNLMRMTKKELISLIINLSEERDCAIDELSNAREEISDMETHEDEFLSLEIAKDLMNRIKNAKFKLDLGVESEREEISKCLDQLEDILS